MLVFIDLMRRRDQHRVHKQGEQMSFKKWIIPIIAVVASVLAATAVTSVVATSLVNRLRATELLRDE